MIEMDVGNIIFGGLVMLLTWGMSYTCIFRIIIGYLKSKAPGRQTLLDALNYDLMVTVFLFGSWMHVLSLVTSFLVPLSSSLLAGFIINVATILAIFVRFYFFYSSFVRFAIVFIPPISRKLDEIPDNSIRVS